MAATQDGQPVGWTGHCRYFVGALTLSDATVYDPPLRMLRCTSAGTAKIVLDGDVAATVITRAMAVGDEITTLAIKMMLTTGASGAYEGYR